MATLTIHGLPDEVRDELAARAARSGRSLQEYLVALLTELAAPPSAEAVLMRARARVVTAGSRVTVEDVLSARDADRR